MIGATMSNAGAVADWLAGLAPKADAALGDAAADLIQRLRDRVDGNLSGGVLNARTGALRASLAAVLSQDSGIIARVTANTPYAAFQEYGFSGSETVRTHLRQQSQAFGKPIRAADVAVRTFSRQVNYPAHSYLRSALAELAPDINRGIATAVAGALQ
jgi:phage gpG-like protein